MNLIHMFIVLIVLICEGLWTRDWFEVNGGSWTVLGDNGESDCFKQIFFWSKGRSKSLALTTNNENPTPG